MKVVICGAGIAGLALVNRMSALDNEIVVLERSTGPRLQGYMIDFFGPGYDAVDAMGLLPAIHGVAYHVREVSFLDEYGRRRAGIQPSRLAVGPLINIMRPDLERVLRESLSSKVDLRFGVSPVAVTERVDGVRVTLDDGGEIDADLLVGADGVHSTVRSLVFGDESRFFRYLGFHTAAFCFEAPEVRAAVQGRACPTDTTDRQMGFYALRDGRVAAFSVRRTPDRVWPDDIRETLRAVYGGLGWIVPTALDCCPPSSEIFYDQVGQIVVPRWSSGRVVLNRQPLPGPISWPRNSPPHSRSAGHWRDTNSYGGRSPRRNRKSVAQAVAGSCPNRTWNCWSGEPRCGWPACRWSIGPLPKCLQERRTE